MACMERHPPRTNPKISADGRIRTRVPRIGMCHTHLMEGWLLLTFDVTLGIPPFGCRAESEEEKTLEVLSRANRR